jgi:hypothetical protein
MSKCVLYIILISSLVTFAYVIYNISQREQYKKLKDVGNFPISYEHKHISKRNNDNLPENKYDGHRYKQRRRYNYNGRDRSRDGGY